MTRPASHRARGAAAWALLACSVAGCSTIGSFAGAAAGIASGAATANPAVAIGVGIGVKTATDTVVKVAGRRIRRAEQDSIAAAAGELAAGEAGSWEAAHPLDLGRRRGEVRVTRAIDTPLAACKEIVFSVAQDDAPQAAGPWYAASVCRQSSRWKWAGAEPAVQRWGSLQ